MDSQALPSCRRSGKAVGGQAEPRACAAVLQCIPVCVGGSVWPFTLPVTQIAAHAPHSSEKSRSIWACPRKCLFWPHGKRLAGTYSQQGCWADASVCLSQTTNVSERTSVAASARPSPDHAAGLQSRPLLCWSACYHGHSRASWKSGHYLKPKKEIRSLKTGFSSNSFFCGQRNSTAIAQK